MRPQLSLNQLINQLKNHFHGWTFDLSEDGFYLVTLPSGEQIVISIITTSLTGSDRPMPQMRIFTDGPIKAYKFSKDHGRRFFLLVYCTTDVSQLKFPAGIDPSDYIVSIESKINRNTGVRLDIRSMYNNIINNNDKDYIKVTPNMHSCTTLSQCSIFRICDSSGLFAMDKLKEYLTYFDSRPYRLDAAEGNRIVFNPSIFYKADEKPLKLPWNLLVHGAPGTGKSHMLNKKINQLLEEDQRIEYERVTFYEDYSYGQFIGEYMPIPVEESLEVVELSYGGNNLSGTVKSDRITYSFVPGPMARLLAKAFASKINGDNKKFILIIEELNRANAASVFGDFFQALDRKEGMSVYHITPKSELASFLFNEVLSMIDPAVELSEDAFKKLRIPDNLYIWATMNSADQGVFPLDSAFKRRWSYIYCDIYNVDASSALRPYITVPIKKTGEESYEALKINWNIFRQEINTNILKAGFAEDRCIGYWFFSEEEVASIENYTIAIVDNRNNGALHDTSSLPNPLVDKLFAYLLQDVFRNTPTSFFREGFEYLSQIRRGLQNLELNGIEVDITSITELPETAYIPYKEIKE